MKNYFLIPFAVLALSFPVYADEAITDTAELQIEAEPLETVAETAAETVPETTAESFPDETNIPIDSDNSAYFYALFDALSKSSAADNAETEAETSAADEENAVDSDELANDAASVQDDFYLQPANYGSPESIDIAYDDNSISLASSDSSADDELLKNVVVYTGKFGGTEYSLLIPYESYQYLVTCNGALYNVGTSAITGRLYTDDLGLDDYDIYNFVLPPVYGSTSAVYSYGSFSYMRHYYLTNSSYSNYRIAYNDTYGKFYVSNCSVFYSSGSRLYYAALVIIFLMGVSFLWKLRK